MNEDDVMKTLDKLLWKYLKYVVLPCAIAALILILWLIFNHA